LNIWERLIREYQAGFGGGGAVGPFSNFPTSQRNFTTQGMQKTFPYDEQDDGQLGEPDAPDMDLNVHGATGFNKAAGRGDGRGRPDMSGGPPTPSSTYSRTWQDMHEAAGMPSVNAPGIAAMDSTDDLGGVLPPLDVNYNTVADEYIAPTVDDNRGVRNMMASTVPGLNPSPGLGDDENIWSPPESDKEEEEDKMTRIALREFFSGEPNKAEEVENPDPTKSKDQSDEELETKVDRVYGQEDNHEFDGGKESSDDSMEFTSDEESDEDDLVGATEKAGEEAEDAVGSKTYEFSLAGMTGLPEPEGETDVGGDPKPEDMEISDDEELPGPPPPGGEDPHDFQLTMEPEAGGMDKLSQLMPPPMGGPSAAPMSMPQVGSMLQKPSAWDKVALEVDGAVINLTKGQQAGQPPAPMAPPMAERKNRRK